MKKGDLVRYKRGLWKIVGVEIVGQLDMLQSARYCYNRCTIEHFAGPKLKKWFGLFGVKLVADVPERALEPLTEMEVLAWAWAAK